MQMKAEVFLSEDYRPADDEPFMNERQTEYFRRKLLNWKAEILEDSRDTVAGMKDQTRNIPDIADRASEETDRSLELRTRDRQRKLVSKIDAALRRIDEGTYGLALVEAVAHLNHLFATGAVTRTRWCCATLPCTRSRDYESPWCRPPAIRPTRACSRVW